MFKTEIMSAFDLTGKTFLVTGASSGIGRQTAVTISEFGGRVCITGRNQQRLDETFTALTNHQDHLQHAADLSNEEDIDSLIEILPGLDGIVHCAGNTSHLPVKFVKSAKIHDLFSVNYEAPVLITTKLLKKKKIHDNSSIVFISSMAIKYPYLGGSLYVSTKSAIEGYSRVLALELAEKGIRSNCISPLFVKTAMVEHTEKTVSKETVERVENMQLLGSGEPVDVANAAVFYLSDASRWVTGTNLDMGGFIK